MVSTRCRTVAAWYAYNVRTITTTDYTPAQIHEIGLKEVARIQGEMDGVMRQVGFKGDRKAFFRFMQTDPQFFFTTREDLIAGYVDIKHRVDPALPKLFELLPKADYEVRAIEPFREKSAAGRQYQAASEDGSRPGVFYANAYDLNARPTLGDGSAVAARGQSRSSLPDHDSSASSRTCRSSAASAATPRTSRAGACTPSRSAASSACTRIRTSTSACSKAELWRSIRLVVDTGLHSKGWTREQVLAYMDANSSAAEARRVSEAERYIAIPGQALAYKIGQLKIRELRTRAETAARRRLRRAQIPHGGAGRRRAAARCARSQDRPLDRGATALSRRRRLCDDARSDVAVAVAAVCLAAPSAGAARRRSPRAPIAIVERTLANGLKIVVWPDHDIPNVAMYTWFKVGSRNEHAGITGISHFFEHMMFNGTKTRKPGEFDRMMEGSGGSNNASTSSDVTIYQDWFPASSLELVFDLESDRMRNLDFDPKVVESERGVVYSERRSRIDNDSFGALAEQVQATAFVAHPYEIPTIGWPSDIEGWNIEDLRSYYQRYYAPNNA